LRPERKRSARYIYVHIIVARRQGHHHLRHYRVNSTPHRCHPYLPVTPNEIVDSAFEAAEAGAAILHLHARDPETGRPDQRADAFAPFLSCIKQGTDAVVNLTSGGSPFMKIEERIQPSVRFKPEPASFNMGSMNFGLFPQLNRFKEFKHDWERQYLESTRDLVFRNTFRDEFAVTALSANGTRFEFECYDVGHLYNLAHFAERGLIKPPFLVQTVFGILGGIGTHSEDVMHMRRKADRLFGAITAGPYLGAGRMQMPIAAMAAATMCASAWKTACGSARANSPAATASRSAAYAASSRGSGSRRLRRTRRGGVADAKSIPPALMKEMYLVGNRPSHYRAFLSLLRNAETWETATKDYARIEVPVLLVWGEQDWARPSEREHDRTLIPYAQMTTLAHGGHFLALDRPAELSQLIVRFAEKPAKVDSR
jgi:uncharacterized protein (DUF849 family)